jgi:hypothetical protein
MGEIIVSGGTTSVPTVDVSNTYLVESGGTLESLTARNMVRMSQVL